MVNIENLKGGSKNTSKRQKTEESVPEASGKENVCFYFFFFFFFFLNSFIVLEGLALL